ncbi:MAG: aspartate/glutamate racemase family protein [Anaerolineales bacterium]
MVRIGLIRVLSLEDEKGINSHGLMLEAFFGDTQVNVVNRCIKGHPKGLYNELEVRAAIPKIVRLGQEMERNDGVQSLLVSCVADPGVPELRAASNLPVIGAGAAAAAVALAMGKPVGALSVVDDILNPIAELLGDRLVAWEVPDGVESTVDLMTMEGKERILEAGEAARIRGAEVILLACTGFSTVRIAPFLEERLRMPVVDPVISAGLLAYYLAIGNKTITS